MPVAETRAPALGRALDWGGKGRPKGVTKEGACVLQGRERMWDPGSGALWEAPTWPAPGLSLAWGAGS